MAERTWLKFRIGEKVQDKKTTIQKNARMKVGGRKKCKQKNQDLNPPDEEMSSKSHSPFGQSRESREIVC